MQNRLILVDSDTQTVEFLKEHGFKVIALSSAEILAVFGSVGELCAVVKNQGEEVEIDFDFLLFKAEDLSVVRKDFTRQSGCYNLLNFLKILKYCLSFYKAKVQNIIIKLILAIMLACVNTTKDAVSIVQNVLKFVLLWRF